jgi:hypothetical protein
MSTKPAFQAVGSVPGGSPECNDKVYSDSWIPWFNKISNIFGEA